MSTPIGLASGATTRDDRIIAGGFQRGARRGTAEVVEPNSVDDSFKPTNALRESLLRLPNVSFIGAHLTGKSGQRSGLGCQADDVQSLGSNQR